jgi:hypothetical protein
MILEKLKMNFNATNLYQENCIKIVKITFNSNVTFEQILIYQRRNQIVGLIPNILSAMCMCLLTITVSVFLSSCAIGLYAAVALLVIGLLCPALFIHWQNYKDTIHGPWDEAVPKFG